MAKKVASTKSEAVPKPKLREGDHHVWLVLSTEERQRAKVLAAEFDASTVSEFLRWLVVWSSKQVAGNQAKLVKDFLAYKEERAKHQPPLPCR